MIRLESIEPILAGQLWQTQREHLEGLSKPVAWFALDESVNQWRPISPHSGERYHWFCSAMQLVDRRGPINDADFSRFVDGVGRTADQFMAIPTAAPARAESIERAGQLDQFCASVDVQIGVNLVSGAEPFLGTKLRGLVEAQGLALRADGLFHAEDDNGNSLFVLGNLEPTLFSPESLRDMQTQGLTMIVDVPRVADGAQVFDRMMLVAKQLAGALGAHVVDDNRQPFGPEAAALIRQQIKHFQGQMQECGMPAGSPLAAGTNATHGGTDASTTANPASGWRTPPDNTKRGSGGKDDGRGGGSGGGTGGAGAGAGAGPCHIAAVSPTPSDGGGTAEAGSCLG